MPFQLRARRHEAPHQTYLTDPLTVAELIASVERQLADGPPRTNDRNGRDASSPSCLEITGNLAGSRNRIRPVLTSGGELRSLKAMTLLGSWHFKLFGNLVIGRFFVSLLG